MNTVLLIFGGIGIAILLFYPVVVMIRTARGLHEENLNSKHEEPTVSNGHRVRTTLDNTGDDVAKNVFPERRDGDN